MHKEAKEKRKGEGVMMRVRRKERKDRGGRRRRNG